MLIYKRVEEGSFKWPRNVTEALEINEQQFGQLMKDFEIIAKRVLPYVDNSSKTLEILAF